ncbi:MAG: DUF308 domain-containing protein [Eubacteriales bacterium]|nr:DUF308 domain-containing protein [Eubacteriales bacterium]
MLKKYLPALLTSLAEIVIGVLLLARPVGFTSIILIAVGAALILKGLLSVVKYFRTEIALAEKEQTLAKGLLAIAAGLFCALKSEWILASFPVVTLLYGVALLIVGLYKVQGMADRLRRHDREWVWAAAGAGAALVSAVVIILNPFASTAAIWIFTAICLLCEAVIELISIMNGLGHRKDGENAAPAGEEEAHAPSFWEKIRARRNKSESAASEQTESEE